MRPIAIIGAMQEEIELLLPKMEETRQTEIAGMVFYSGTLAGSSAVLVRCGIGKVNAAVCTQILIDRWDVRAVVNTGVAGSANPSLNVGDVVIARDVIQHDFDTTYFGDEIGLIPRLGMREFPADAAMAELTLATAGKLPGGSKAIIGRVASGDQFISDRAVKQKIRESVSPDCVDMESAAIGQACWLNGVPFVIIRSISDSADESATVDFAEFTRHAAEISSRLCENMLAEF